MCLLPYPRHLFVYESAGDVRVPKCIASPRMYAASVGDVCGAISSVRLRGVPHNGSFLKICVSVDIEAHIIYFNLIIYISTRDSSPPLTACMNLPVTFVWPSVVHLL